MFLLFCRREIKIELMNSLHALVLRIKVIRPLLRLILILNWISNRSMQYLIFKVLIAIVAPGSSSFRGLLQV